jgi:hypothetical protein
VVERSVVTGKLHLLACLGDGANGGKVGRKTRRAGGVANGLNDLAPVLSRAAGFALPKMCTNTALDSLRSSRGGPPGIAAQNGRGSPKHASDTPGAPSFSPYQRIAASPIRRVAVSLYFPPSASNAFLTLFGRRIRSPRFTRGDPLR